MTLQQLHQVITIAESRSMNEASRKLFVSQPNLSAVVRELEEETGITIFIRSNRGIVLTPEGEEFIGYAKQVVEQYHLLESRYISSASKKKFSVSMQHYTFAVQAFIKVAKELEMDDYEFSVHETKTYEVIENVKKQHSEIGVLYRNEFNREALSKIFRENALEFKPLFSCDIYVFMASSHPLAGKEKITFEDLRPYPNLAFGQGDNNSFYLAEEVFSTHEYRQSIKADDRATMLNLMIGLNGYTLCSGIICNELNGDEYVAVPFDTDEKMEIGYIKKKNMPLTVLGEKYIAELKKYKAYEETEK